MPNTLHRQRGITLVVGMVMLMLMTLLVVSGFNASDTNLKVVGNMQTHQEALSTAQQGIENTIGVTTFFRNKVLVVANPVPVDANGDDQADYEAVITPTCFRHRPVDTTSLNVADPADKPCFGTGASQNTGIFGGGAAASSASLCSDTWWNIQATVTDASSGTQTEVHQGVTVRVPRTDADNNCE